MNLHNIYTQVWFADMSGLHKGRILIIGDIRTPFQLVGFNVCQPPKDEIF